MDVLGRGRSQESREPTRPVISASAAELREAQFRHDAMAVRRIVRTALFG
ncbi:hypothetical protein [Streptomyces sp. NPDC050287]